MKIICFYIYSLAPGGAERQVSVLAAALARRGLQVHVLCHKVHGIYGHYLDELTGTGVTVHVLDSKALAMGATFVKSRPDLLHKLDGCPVPLPQCLLVLGRLLKIAPDILHCYLSVGNCIGGCAGVLAQVPGIMLSCRGLSPQNAGTETFDYQLPVYRFLCAQPFVRLEANSMTVAASFAEWLDIPLSTIQINPNGLVPERYATKERSLREQVRESLGIAPDTPLVLYISRDAIEKRVDDMAAVCALLQKDIPYMRVLAVGAGLGQNDEFQSRLRRYGCLSNVLSLGIRKDIPDLLTAADVLLLTSQAEGFPNVIMEAMFAKLPIVSTNAGGIPELVIHGETGFLHPVGDVSGMAKSLVCLLRDQDLRARMGARGKERIVANFTVDRLVDRTIRHYGALLHCSSENFIPKSDQ